MSVAAIGAVDYTKALDGLSLKQAQLMLTTQGIVGEEQKDLLVKQGLIATSDRMSASIVSEALANTALNKEQQEAILIKAGLMKQETKELITGNACTEAKLRAILAEKGIKGAKADTLIASILQTGQNAKEAISWDVLAASIKKSMIALAQNPLTWIAVAVGAVVGFIKVVDHFAITAEKLNDQLQELKATEEELISTQDKLTEIDNKIAEIQSRGTLSITDNADISRLQIEKSLLEGEIELLKIRKELQQDEYNKNAKKYADGEYSNYTHGQGDITHLMNSYKGYKAKSERTDIDDYFIEDAKRGLKETEAELIEYRNTINENLANLAPDDEESRKKLETIREAIEKLIYTEEELAKIKFDRFIIDPNNTGISEGFEKIKSDGEVTTQEIIELANKFPTLKKFMDDNGISAETLAAELNNVGTEAENSGENVNKMTVSLSEMKTASESISALSAAFKQLSDDGYISTESMSKIKDAVGDGINNWEDYEKVLMRAKVGSAEFNKAMGELTYAMIEKTIGTDKLAEADVNYIARLLEENGVLNANAVAQDIVTVAKEKSLIVSSASAANYLYENLTLKELTDATNETIEAKLNEAGISSTLEQREYALAQARAWAALKAYDGTEASYTHVAGLLSECGSAAVTEQAMIGLKNAQDIYNVSTLDVSQKVGALQELGYFLQHDLALMQQMANTSITYSDGKWWVNAWDENGNWLGADEYHGFDFEYNYTPPEITVPQYSGGSGKGGSDKNEALDNYLKYCEDLYKVHQDELKYIHDIQWGYDNLTKTDEERLEIAQDIEEARKNYAENRIKDIEHEIELLQNLQGEETDVLEHYKEIQRIAHEEANRLRELGYDNNSNEVQDWQKKWWDAEKEMLNWRFTNSQNWIDERNRLGDWHLWGDSEINAWERVLKWLREDYPHAIDEIKEAEEKLYDKRKEAFKEATDFGSSYFDSKKSLLQSHYDITNSIAEAQHEIKKELKASMTMYEYLDEETRKLLFNQEDYNVLSSKLNGIQLEANRLQSEYTDKLQNATIDNLEEITSHYEMQYETLMKSYEIAKADLEVAKKKQKLNNVLNERNVRMLINGQWTWVANTQDVIDAQNELAEAEYERDNARLQLEQTNSMNALTAQQDKLKTTISEFDRGVITLNDAVGRCVDIFGVLPTSIQNALSRMSGMSVSGGSNTSSSFSYSSGGSSGIGYDSGTDYMSKILSSTNKQDVIWYNEARNNKIDGEGMSEGKLSNSQAIDRWESAKNKHADGTRYTPGGNTLLGEVEPEMYIDNNGHLIPINQPTIGNIGAGGIVFNQAQLENMRSLWDLSNVNMANISGLLTDRMTTRGSGGGDNILNGNIIVNNPQNFNEFVREVTSAFRRKPV